MTQKIELFKNEWTDQYMFSHSTKPLCLICCETVVLIKRWNVKQHNKTKHRSFEEIYPQKSDESVRKTCMRMALTPFKPRFKLLSGHFSH